MTSNKKRFRKNVFYVRVTDAERQMILDRANRCHMKIVSDYIRIMAIDGCIFCVDDSEHIDKVAYELHKIGVNINQIAHAANATQTISADEVKIIQQQQKEIWKLLNRLLSTTIPYLEDYPYET